MTMIFPSRRKVGEKIREWIRRYAIQELVACACALIVAQYVRPMLLASHLTWAKVLAVSIVVIADGVAFYGYGTIREWIRNRSLKKTARDVAFEYTLASISNMLFFRPYFVYHLPRIVGDVNAGIILAQVFAGITFYVVAIPMYELRKRMFKD